MQDTLESALEKMAQRPVGYREHHEAVGSPTLGVHSGWMTNQGPIGGYLRDPAPRRSGSTRARPESDRGGGIRNPRRVPPGQPGHPYAAVNPPPHHRRTEPY